MKTITFEIDMINKKCDLGPLERMRKEFRKETVTFSDQELLCRLFGLFDQDQLEANFTFIKHVAKKFGVSEDMFEDFTGRELK